MASQATLTADKTERFQLKRERIIDAAAELINDQGVRSMTFVDVAQKVDLNTTSITYYFKRKELLAEAAFERAMDASEEMVMAAAAERTPRERVAKFVALELERWARIRRRELPRTAQLSEVRAMEDPVRTRLGERYVDIVRRVRGFFGPDTDGDIKALNIARTHILIENMFWMLVWLDNYSNTDFERIHGRIMEVFDHGIAGSEGAWVAEPLEPSGAIADSDQSGPEAFLRAATRLINQRGYRGASVDRIASELDVTKGSFYHHLDTKDDLVLQCFERSYLRITELQQTALKLDADSLTRISRAIDTLLRIQLFGDFPLLRTSALHALPQDLRAKPMARSGRIAQRFGGMLIDGISDGSIRPIDPIVASQMVVVAINVANELRPWADRQSEESAIGKYAGIIAHGLFHH